MQPRRAAERAARGSPTAAASADRVTPAARPRLYCRGNDAGSYACFQPYGDKVRVKDTTANGMSAAAVWKTSYGREGVCINIPQSRRVRI